SELGNTSTLCDILVLQFATSGQAKQNYALFVDCAWRLEWNNSVIAGSEDGEPNRGSTELLLGQTLMRAEVFAPALDMTLFFSEGVSLRFFSTRNDVSEQEGESTQWRLYGPKGYYLSVGPGI